MLFRAGWLLYYDSGCAPPRVCKWKVAQPRYKKYCTLLLDADFAW